MAVLPKPWADSMQADSEPLEDAMLYLRLDPVVLGGRRDSVEGSFEGKTDYDAVRGNASGFEWLRWRRSKMESLPC